ncbi:hypothetical protein Pelo_3721 [Pelomyxa schiedti]|nr:hypothetical protein Pelo_3721 [Pelomyxa schiedti]
MVFKKHNDSYKRNGILGLIFTAVFYLAWGSISSIPIFVTALKQHFDLNQKAVASLSSTTFLVTQLSMFLAPLLSKSASLPQIALVTATGALGFLGLCLSSFFLDSPSDLWMLLLCCAVIAVSAGLSQVCVQGPATHLLIKEKKQLVSGIVATSLCVGAIITSAVCPEGMGKLISAEFLGVALAMLIVGTICAIVIPTLYRRFMVGAPIEETKSLPTLQIWKEFFTGPTSWLVIVCVVCKVTEGIVITSNCALIAETFMDPDLMSMSTVAMLYLICQLIGRTLSIFLVFRHSPLVLMIVGSFIYTVLLILLSVWDSGNLILLFLSGFGILYGLLLPLTSPFLFYARVSNDRAWASIAPLTMVPAAVLSMIVNLLAGHVYDKNGVDTDTGTVCYGSKCWRDGFIICAVAAIIGMIASGILFAIAVRRPAQPLHSQLNSRFEAGAFRDKPSAKANYLFQTV